MTDTGGPVFFRDEGGVDSGPKLKGPTCLAQLLSWWAVPQFHQHCRPQTELWVTQAALTGVGDVLRLEITGRRYRGTLCR